MPRGWVTAAELRQWLDDYNAADVTVSAVDLGGIEWAHCLSSDMRRAHVTAQTAFTGPITFSEDLREADVAPFQTGSLRLPIFVWRWMLRLAWATAHRSQRSIRDAFMQRVLRVAEKLAAQDRDTLVVCHAGVMHFLRKELLRRGYTGPRFAMAENARLYIFERALPNREAATDPSAAARS